MDTQPSAVAPAEALERFGAAELARGIAAGRWSASDVVQIAAIRPSSADGFWSLVEAQNAYCRRFTGELDRRGIDALLAPVHALPALTHGSAYYLATAASYSMLYNLLGIPAGVVPVTRVRDGEALPRTAGRDVVERAAAEVERGSAGLPIGVQVVARHWREDIVLAVMAQLERALWANPEYPTLPPAG